MSAASSVEPEAAALPRTGSAARLLFLTGFVVLFLELSAIRWFATYVVFLQFFTNVVLLASFLGMSCGCMAAQRPSDWLRRVPALTLLAVAAALVMQTIFTRWSAVMIDVGGQASPQEVFFGTEYRDPDVSRFVVPIEAVGGVFFVLIVLVFVGLGQVLGRAFDAYPDRVRGYSLNIGGSLLGIALFSLVSFLEAPPAVWFLVCCAGIAWLLQESGWLTGRQIGLLALVVLAVWLRPIVTDRHNKNETRWSPYYAVEYRTSNRMIRVNGIGHQQIIPYADAGASYSLIHLLEKASGGPQFRDVLVIGAGAGNDVDHALRFGAARVDAVEIDPVIEALGKTKNPDHAYQDPRVVPHLDDGRHFLRTTERKYDLVVYGLVDSLILHSSYSNIRLESYLFTQEAFADIARVLKPGGTFVTYNYFRQDWIVERVAAMAKAAFGCAPTVLSLPYRAELGGAAAQDGLTMVIAGCNPRIADAFARSGTFWLDTVPPDNRAVNGFGVRPDALPQAERVHWLKIAPSRLPQNAAPIAASDDWPFLYLEGRLIPDLSLRWIAVLGALGLGLVYLFLPKRAARFDGRMFFLGAAFMLLEAKAVVQLALLFGSTWLVNSAVFFTVLVLILLANLYVLKRPRTRLLLPYAGLIALLLVAVATPLDLFLEGGMLWRYAAPCVLALGPVFFAGIIFARSFAASIDPDQAFGSNVAGAVLGGLSESLSMLLGFRHLLLVAVLFYLLSAAWPSLGRRVAMASR